MARSNGLDAGHSGLIKMVSINSPSLKGRAQRNETGEKTEEMKHYPM